MYLKRLSYCPKVSIPPPPRRAPPAFHPPPPRHTRGHHHHAGRQVCSNSPPLCAPPSHPHLSFKVNPTPSSPKCSSAVWYASSAPSSPPPLPQAGPPLQRFPHTHTHTPSLPLSPPDCSHSLEHLGTRWKRGDCGAVTHVLLLTNAECLAPASSLSLSVVMRRCILALHPNPLTPPSQLLAPPPPHTHTLSHLSVALRCCMPTLPPVSAGALQRCY